MIDCFESAKGAQFSENRSHRYALWRRIPENEDLQWNKGKDFALFIGLNPSIADEERLDPTVTRCYNYARRWGYHFLLMGNLYSKVSTDPKKVNFSAFEDDEDFENLSILTDMVKMADRVILCWGTNANPKIADFFLRGIRGIYPKREFHCLGVTKDNMPRHPLYLRSDVVPIAYMSDDARFRSGLWE